VGVFSEKTRTGLGMGANRSLAVYLPAWPWVSAQKTILRSAVALLVLVGRMM
jgi:hypothetical protein